MIKYLLDANVCIYLINNSYPELRRALYRFTDEDFGISSVVVHELIYGVKKSQHQVKNQLRLEEFLSPFQILDFDEAAAEVAANIRTKLSTQGVPIGPYDLFIAAHAISLNATLVTHNIQEFARIPNLKIEDWVREAKGVSQENFLEVLKKVPSTWTEPEDEL